MWKLFVVIVLLVGVCWATSCGSDDSVCEEAGAKILSCIKSLDCTSYDGMMRSMCEAAQNPQATTTQEGECEGQDKEDAQMIIDCEELDKDQLCAVCVQSGG